MRRPRLIAVWVVLVIELLPVAATKGRQDPGTGDGVSEAQSVGGSRAELRSASVPGVPHDGNLLGGAATPAAPVTPIKGESRRLAPSLPRRSPLLIGLYISHGVLQALDAQSTARALRSGSAREGNPIVRPFASHPAGLFAFKLGAAGGAMFAIDRLHKRHPRLATAILAAIDAGYACVVVRNYRKFPAQ